MRTRNRRHKKRISNKRISNKRISNKARGKYRTTPRRVHINETLNEVEVENIIIDAGGDPIKQSYLSKTGHNLEEDLKNISFIKDSYMGSTLGKQVVLKLTDWLKGNYGNDRIT
jgi:hypothetical protein